jgi:hypothetical protein
LKLRNPLLARQRLVQHGLKALKNGEMPREREVEHKWSTY